MGEREEERKDPENVDIIILLAGEGKRLLPLTRDRPKGLICCEDGLSIFEHTVKSLDNGSWNPTILPVIGHGREMMEETIESLRDYHTIQPVYNPFYASKGPLFSLYLGLAQSKSHRLLIINGDTLIRESLFQRVQQWIKREREDQGLEVGVCVSPSKHFYQDDMKILLTEKSSFLKVGKDLLPGPMMVKSAGVISIKDRRSREALTESLFTMMKRRETLKESYHWHNLLNVLTSTFTIDFIEVKEKSWYEIDTLMDLRVLDSKQLFYIEDRDQEDELCYRKGYR